MSAPLWRLYLESYLAVREAMGQPVRAERKLLGEFSWPLWPSVSPAGADRSGPNGHLTGRACSRRAGASVDGPDA